MRIPPISHQSLIECDVLEGLEELAIDELHQLAGASRIGIMRAGVVQCNWRGDLQPLLSLRSITSAYLSLTFAVPRPKALLGHQHFTALLGAIDAIQALHPPRSFTTLRISAAGEDSAVMQRLRDQLATQLGLQVAQDEADLLIRLRPNRNGWEALLRISPRPLATRTWRVCNYAGALNASLAHAMAWMTNPQPTDVVLNLCCGSGTLLIERLVLGRVQTAIGCDTNPHALACAEKNLTAAGFAKQVRLESWDATNLPLDTGSMHVLLADLPFGQLSGSHRENELLYPRILAEAARVAAPAAWMVLLTHELRLLEQAAERYAELWKLHDIVRVRSSGMTPGIFVFERT